MSDAPVDSSASRLDMMQSGPLTRILIILGRLIRAGVDMRHWFHTISVVAILASGAVFAADLPSNQAPPVFVAPLPTFTWTGFYVGAHVGYGWGQEGDNLSTYALPSDSFNVNGMLGGVHAGYNWQTNQLVLGIEADFDGSGVQGTGSLLPASPGTVAL